MILRTIAFCVFSLAINTVALAQSGTNGAPVIACISMDAISGIMDMFSDEQSSKVEKLPFIALRDQELHQLNQRVFFKLVSKRLKDISLTPTAHFTPMREAFALNEVPDYLAMGRCRLSSMSEGITDITSQDILEIKTINLSAFSEQIGMTVYRHPNTKNGFTQVREISRQPSKFAVGFLQLTCAQEFVRFSGPRGYEFTFNRRRVTPHISIDSLESYFERSRINLVTFIMDKPSTVTVEIGSMDPVKISKYK